MTERKKLSITSLVCGIVATFFTHIAYFELLKFPDEAFKNSYIGLAIIVAGLVMFFVSRKKETPNVFRAAASGLLFISLFFAITVIALRFVA